MEVNEAAEGEQGVDGRCESLWGEGEEREGRRGEEGEGEMVKRLERENAELRGEVEILRHLMFLIKEDLNVKNEQFDYLYTSLKAAREQSERERKLASRAAESSTTRQQRQKMPPEPSPTPPSHPSLPTACSCTTTTSLTASQPTQPEAGRNNRHNGRSYPWLTSLLEDLTSRVVSNLSALELTSLALASRTMRRCTDDNQLWAALYRQRYQRVQSVEDAGLTWKQRFARRFCTALNWRKGKAGILTLRGHSGTVTSVAFDGHHIISASDDGSIALWAMARQPTRQSTVLRPPPALALAQLAQGKVASSQGVYGAGNGAELHRPANGYSSFLQAEKLMSFHGHGGPVWAVSVDFSLKRLASGSYDKTIKCWDLRTGSCTATLRGHGAWVSCLSLHQAVVGRIVSGSWDATIKVWDEGRGVARRSLHCGVGNALYCLHWHTGQPGLVAVGCRHRQIQLWDLESGNNVTNFHGHLKEVGAVHMQDKLVISGSGDTTVKVWDRVSGGCEVSLRGHTATVMSVQCQPDLHTVLSGSYDKTSKVWDLRQPGEALHTFRGHTGAVFVVKGSEEHLLTGSADGTILLHDFSSTLHG